MLGFVRTRSLDRGITVGEGAIVGARAVAMKDVTPWSIVIGNPARQTKRREIIQ
jgi:putative colanic acid biosynthesis acetyltransferase WcaF